MQDGVKLVQSDWQMSPLNPASPIFLAILGLLISFSMKPKSPEKLASDATFVYE
jgi:hypothetical protein